jgi:hypothetical protein
MADNTIVFRSKRIIKERLTVIKRLFITSVFKYCILLLPKMLCKFLFQNTARGFILEYYLKYSTTEPQT